MIKNFIVSFCLLIPVLASAQNSSSLNSEYDTLQVFDNKALVAFDFEYSRGQAYQYSDSLVFHGIIYSQWKDGKYRVGEYENGAKVKMQYFNKDSIEIKREEFYGGYRSHGDPESGTLYYMDGKKK